MKKKFAIIFLLVNIAVILFLFCFLKILVNVEINTEVGDRNIVLYIDNGLESSFDEKNKIIKKLSSGKDFQKLSFDVSHNKINKLRLDLGNEEGEYVVKSITVGGFLFPEVVLKGEEILTCFKMTNDIEHLDLDKEGNVIIKVSGNDGYIASVNLESYINYKINDKILTDFCVMELISIIISIIIFILINKHRRNAFCNKLQTCRKVLIKYCQENIEIVFVLNSFAFSIWTILNIPIVNYLTVQFIGGFCLFFLTCHILKYLQIFKDDSCKYYCLIIIFVLFAFLPLLINGVFYYDDLWGFSQHQPTTVGLIMRRPFIDIIFAMFHSIDVSSSYYMRLFNASFICLFAMLIYKFMVDLFKDKNIAFFLSVTLTANVVIVDILGYLSIFPVVFALLFSAFGFISFGIFYRSIFLNRSKAIVYFLIAFLSLLSGFLYYQIITPVVLIFVVMELIAFEKFNQRIQTIKYFFFTLFYGVTSVIYLFITKFLLIVYSLPVDNARGEFIHGIDKVLEKILWFFSVVIPNSVAHLVAFFWGNFLFNENCMFYQISFQSDMVRFFSYFIVLLGISACWAIIARRKKFGLLISLVLFVPLSFYCFLILPESTYLTYYALPLIMLLGTYFIFGITNLFNKLSIRKNIGLFLLLILVLQSNIYANNFWVRYNLGGYENLRNVIANNITEDARRIHIYGKLVPFQANVYAVMAANLVLKELKLNVKEYHITSSDNEYYMSVIQEDEFERMCLQLNQEEIGTLNRHYSYGKMYRNYSLRRLDFSKEELHELQRIFIKSGMLPSDDEKVVKVNLNKTMGIFYKF